ncbi:MAG: peptidylprolyl isomerase [Clostridia bacterium]|nr:peptidylprolyl isomerase [Clostridia bacterium]
MAKEKQQLTVFEEKRKTLIKKIIAVMGLVMIVAIAVVLAVMAFDKYKSEKYLESYGETALRVGSYDMDYGMYRCRYLNYRDEYIREYTENGVTDTAALDSFIRACVADDARYTYAKISLAADYGYSLTSADVVAIADTYAEAMKDYCETNKMDFEETLAAGYMDEEIFTFSLRVMALEDVLRTALISDGGEIEDNDEKLLEIFKGDEMIHVKSVFIENDDGEDIEENRRIAEEVIEKYKGGTEFNKLIGNYSEDVYGDYYMTRGEKADAYDTAAFSLDDGEISDVVVAPDGFYVILRAAKDEEYIENNFETLKSQYQAVRLKEKIEARMNSFSVVETEFLRGLSYGEIE